VKLADGSNPPGSAVIERVCGASVTREAYTDSKGRFSFMFPNSNNGVFSDASIAGGITARVDALGRQSERDLVGCEIRAHLAGFVSSSISLGFRRALDDPNIGTIYIQPITGVQGSTFSVTTALASKDARKAYEKGIDNAKKEKWGDAERELAKAVQIYPDYVIAWYELGKVYQRLKKTDDARNAYLEALRIDPKFVGPYGPLIAINVNQQKWEDVAGDFSKVLRLDPFVAPDLYFYGAVANYNLSNVDLAETYAREAASRDDQRRIPKIYHLLGVILARRGDYAGARDYVQTYLKLRPQAIDDEEIKLLLADIDKGAAIP
jgi:Flp pilus assembly protein TadD